MFICLHLYAQGIIPKGHNDRGSQLLKKLQSKKVAKYARNLCRYYTVFTYTYYWLFQFEAQLIRGITVLAATTSIILGKIFFGIIRCF